LHWACFQPLADRCRFPKTDLPLPCLRHYDVALLDENIGAVFVELTPARPARHP
jgi:hypothetical protein